MKEASGELNMTLITVIAIGLILGVVSVFIPNILQKEKMPNFNGWTSSL